MRKTARRIANAIQERRPQTRLGFHLRQLADRLEMEGNMEDAFRARLAAVRLDQAAVSLGRKGEAVKTMATYKEAERTWHKLTGKVYGAGQ